MQKLQYVHTETCKNLEPWSKEERKHCSIWCEKLTKFCNPKKISAGAKFPVSNLQVASFEIS